MIPAAAFSLTSMLIELIGGLALFLFGLEQMTAALKVVAGSRLRDLLARMTSNRFVGVLTGAFVTAIIQSSSVTTVLVVGFISAGLMSMSQAIGVIMGANIGTTVTAQIIAFKVTKAALPIFAGGFVVWFLAKRETIRSYGGLAMGLGLVFLGMTMMSTGMKPLRSEPAFLELMRTIENPALGILVAAAFTGLVQSSSATTGVVIAMATQGLISLEAGIALTLGANIGTCVTAGLAAIGKPREAVRAAVVHVLFNVAGVLLWAGFIDQLAELVRHISPASVGLTGVEQLSADAPRQIANAHTVFNIANTVILIWFAPLMARVVNRLVPDRPLAESPPRKSHLDDALLLTPTLALDAARREMKNMAEIVDEMLQDILPAMVEGDRAKLEELRDRDAIVDEIYDDTVLFLGKVSRKALTEQVSGELTRLLGAVNDLENIGDVVETNLVNLGCKLIDAGVRVSDETAGVLGGVHAAVIEAVRDAAEAVVTSDVALANKVIELKADITGATEDAATHEAQRLIADEPDRIAAYRAEMDILEKQRRIYYFAKKMAKSVAL